IQGGRSFKGRRRSREGLVAPEEGRDETRNPFHSAYSSQGAGKEKSFKKSHRCERPG
ncbi:hypothetical protein CSUI_007999, partial [Cystoisospora suis]